MSAPVSKFADSIEDDRIHPHRIYTRRDAAALLGRTRKTLLDWAAKGIGPKVTRLTPDSPPEYLGRDLLDFLGIREDA